MCAVRFRASRTNGEGSDEGSSPVTSTITGVYAHPDERETDLSVSLSFSGILSPLMHAVFKLNRE